MQSTSPCKPVKSTPQVTDQKQAAPTTSADVQMATQASARKEAHEVTPAPAIVSSDTTTTSKIAKSKDVDAVRKCPVLLEYVCQSILYLLRLLPQTIIIIKRAYRSIMSRVSTARTRYTASTRSGTINILDLSLILSAFENSITATSISCHWWWQDMWSKAYMQSSA